jgi:glycosyltransferase involved in cell wall biosynthesis
MKILYLSEYSAPNICGVWTRVCSEARYMAKKGHKIFIFSTNINKSGGILPAYEKFEGMNIFRFKPLLRISENSSFWAGKQFRKRFLEIKPDIVICNTYRHPESIVALKLSKKLNIPCILVTHAPFLEKGVRRKSLGLAVWIYDRIYGRKLKEFSKIFSIAKWELPYLLELGAPKNKIEYIPNTIPDELFRKKAILDMHKILFLGRIAPVKDIETLLKAMKLTGSKYKLILAGPTDKEYDIKLNQMIINLKIKNNVKFTGPIYDLSKKIKLIQGSGIFVLPSKREGLPQSLLEAMALGRICISSKNQGAKEIISDGKNGFLFEISNEKQLSEKIISLKNHNLNSISKNAVLTAKKFSASEIFPKTERIYSGLVRKKSLVP